MDRQFAIAIDTSGRVGSVAVGANETVLAEKYFSDQMKHAAELFPVMLELVAEAGHSISDVSDVYITAGPGSFTGLRIGVTVAKMMALASNVKIAAVSSLDCVAQNAFDYIYKEARHDIKTVTAIIDAKRGQFFVGLYDNIQDKWVRRQPECMMTAEEIISSLNARTLFTGEGLKYYKSKFVGDNTEFMPEDQWSIKASTVYTQGRKKAAANQYDDPQILLPQYLRLSDAEENLLKKLTDTINRH